MEFKEYSIISDSKNDESSSSNDFIIYNMKLTDELVEKLMKGQKDLNNLQGIEFIHTGKGSDLLKIEDETFPFMKVKETQPVHLLSNPTKSSHKMHLIGSMTHKLNPKLELEASKAEVIRQRSQDAEKERLARKTVELDVLPQGNLKGGQKRLIKRRPSVTNGSVSVFNRSLTSTPVNSGIPLRTRIIQILAIGPISIDQLLIKLNCNVKVDDIKPFLKEVCVDGISDLRALRLKAERFEEVKVTDWPYYSMRERDIVARSVKVHQQDNSTTAITATPPETPETPSPKKQSVSINARPIGGVTSVPNSAKKTTTSVKDRLNALMKRRK